ncbi:MAG: pyridoxamine 5'-phosphate oxidase family protein [Actinomycetota bacterium]|jgi:nitroimidazol reductase NimA-like FMN-containing flavoprotein (pyridoxamine 5'-phosphate oxidase superfamily)|nr:pyridoxamine 5'-phosphate oxidase family protein [Actinomycetota bacterium]
MNTNEGQPLARLLDPQGHDVTPLPWGEARARIDAARFDFFTTLHTSGRPHTRPVLAVWTGEALFTTTTRAAQKGRNLRSDPRCSVAIMADDMHIVIEGTAAKVQTRAALERVAEAYRSKYNWPVTVVGGGFDAPYAAPAAGPLPYEPYRITPTAVYGWGTNDVVGPRHTRWWFPHETS